MAKFLICTMYCGERDFDHHVAALMAQSGDHVIEHRVFRDMIEVDGHNAVYQAFNGAGPDVICGKVDADVVLNAGALDYVAKTINPNMWLDPETHDYFTDGALSAGLAFYGPNVTFKHQLLTLKCDRDVASQCVLTRCGVLGKHAHHSDTWTGFRYGFHRGLKSQLPVYEKVKQAYAVHHDAVRLAAIRGFDLAQSDLYREYHLTASAPPMDHNYNNPRLRELFELYGNTNVPLPPRTWR
jgi:hypothetical protein